MTRVLNALDAATAADIRAAISGRPNLKAAKAAPSPKQPKCMCSQFHKFDPPTNRHTVQLPIYLGQEQIKEFVPPYGMSGDRVTKVLRAKRYAYQKLRNGVGVDIERYFPNGIETLTAIQYVRFSMYAGGPKEMDDDNVSAVFKPVRDALCSVAYYGSAWRQHIDTIGNADGYLKQRGVTWLYRQAKCAGNPRLHGIQLILHCAPNTTT
jgi:hypothetical protein